MNLHSIVVIISCTSCISRFALEWFKMFRIFVLFYNFTQSERTSESLEIDGRESITKTSQTNDEICRPEWRRIDRF